MHVFDKTTTSTADQTDEQLLPSSNITHTSTINLQSAANTKEKFPLILVTWLNYEHVIYMPNTYKPEYFYISALDLTNYFTNTTQNKSYCNNAFCNPL